MDNNKLLYLFKKYIDSEYIVFDGIRLIPVGVSQETKNISFILRNIDDVSYSKTVLQDELIEILEKFSDFVNINFEPQIENSESVYISAELSKKVSDFFKSIKKISIYDNNYKEIIEFEGESMGFDAEHENDMLIFYNFFKPYSAKVINEPENKVINTNINQIIENYYDLIEEYGYSWESEEIYIKMDKILNSSPLLSPDWMVAYYTTQFIKTKGT